MRHRAILAAFFLVVMLAGGFVAGRAHAAQPHMASARNHLRSARAELERAEADKGGHRERAVRLVDDAIAEVDSGMAFSRPR